MGELMAACIKYVNSDNTKDPGCDDEKSNKGKKSGNGKGQQQNMAGHNGNNQGNGGKRRHLDGGSDLVANTNTGYKNQRRNNNGKPPYGKGKSFNLEAALNDSCLKHSFPDKPSTHGWKDCWIMREFRNYGFSLNQGNNNGPPGGSRSGSQGSGFGGGGSSSGYPGQGNQGGYNQQSGQGNQ